MKKILIKANMSNLNGLSYHRLIVPYAKVSDMQEFQIDVFQDISLLDENKLKEYSAVIFQREIDVNGKSIDLINYYHSLGLKVIFDIDDYWVLPQTHPLFKVFKEFNIVKQTEDILKHVDLVTTTTKHLASKISKFNKSVEVLPNCLDLDDEQWKSNKTYSQKVRFGYIAGVHHMVDVRILQMPIRKILRQNINAMFVLGGYNDNDHYKYYENVMTAGNLNSNSYMRINSMPVHDYGTAYNHTDVSLIPLEKSDFSACKSEIKLLEAAAHNNAAIVSNCLPYNTFPSDTAIFLENSDVNGWFKAIKRLSADKSLIQDYSQRLKEYTTKNYDLNKWTNTRKQILRSVLA